jgi:hypothetical protein
MDPTEGHSRTMEARPLPAPSRQARPRPARIHLPAIANSAWQGITSVLYGPRVDIGAAEQGVHREQARKDVGRPSNPLRAALAIVLASDLRSSATRPIGWLTRF